MKWYSFLFFIEKNANIYFLKKKQRRGLLNQKSLIFIGVGGWVGARALGASWGKIPPNKTYKRVNSGIPSKRSRETKKKGVTAPVSSPKAGGGECGDCPLSSSPPAIFPSTQPIAYYGQLVRDYY